MTAERRYTIAADAGKTPLRGAESAATGMEEPGPLTGFQATYGSLNARAAKEALQLQAAVGVQSVFAMQNGGKPAWSDLFDSPSHVLPPLSSLLPMYLDLMIAREPQTVE